MAATTEVSFHQRQPEKQGFLSFLPLSAHSRCPVLVSAELSQALMTTFPE